ncbi:MAG TPA: hypothetical protein VFZ65_07760 [Planctomycetota bacterium]|nr:hypothetical protein [Planctomycetota bacterium]
MNHPVRYIAFAGLVTVLAASLLQTSCVDQVGRSASVSTSESCMKCHNGSQHDDYAGSGLENPHQFPGDAEVLKCTVCHGGNPNGVDAASSHVPPPPEIGDRQFQDNDAHAWFNKLTLAGIDKMADYTVNGVTYTGIDYLQFLNPSDLRVTRQARGCGQCHQEHSDGVSRGPIASSMGIFSGSFYAVGMQNAIPAHQGLFEDNAADYAWRAVDDPSYTPATTTPGRVGQLIEPPVWSSRSTQGAAYLFRNQAFTRNNLVTDVNPNGSVVTGSRLAKLYQEMVAFTCGDCHLGSSGANNRYADFRPSGCAGCHMPYSLDGRSRSRDPNVPKTEPFDPDQIRDPERAHVRSHRIRGVARTLSNGVTVQGIDDVTCAGCHQGSNRMVMQYWGIRLDQNQDVRRGFQYPANPVTFRTTRLDTRLFDPVVDNNTFNGRNANQYLLFEDYDGDGRDDTPADVHYEAGMGCIDCHGSVDLHGNVAAANAGDIVSRMGHAVTIRCEDCHGTASAPAVTTIGTDYSGNQVSLAVDSEGNALRHVERDSSGDYWLTSKLDGRRHYIRQVHDVIVDSGKIDPTTGQPVYTAMGSYAMGRDDSLAGTGLGPQQTGGAHAGFSHLDSMNCASCHSSWSNSCIGCHLEGQYDEGNNFSNITGERIVFKQRFAEFVYQSPVPFSLGIGMDNKIRTSATNTKVFFRYTDINGDRTPVFAFTDRNGGGANPAAGHPSLGHNAFLAHSIRGRVTATNEGPRYCVSCHLTDSALANYGTQYAQFRATLAANDYGNLDYNLLKQHIGKNPGNQLDSPFFVHMVAGLGTGLFLFDRNGAAQNPLDDNPNRYASDGVAPKDYFDPAQVYYDLDRVVDENGVSTGSSNQPMNQPIVGPNRRDGATNPNMAGPLGMTLSQRLADPAVGIVLNSWVDADRTTHGGASAVIGQ